MDEIRLGELVARNSIRQVGEEEQHSHSAGQQGGGVVGQLLQAGPSPAAGFRRLPDVHQHVDGHDRQEQRGGEVDEPGCLQRFLCRGSNPEGSQFRVPRMSGMKAPAIMQAMPSSRLLMLTVISFPDPALIQEVEAAPDASETILRFSLLRGSRLGFGAA